MAYGIFATVNVIYCTFQTVTVKYCMFRTVTVIDIPLSKFGYLEKLSNSGLRSNDTDIYSRLNVQRQWAVITHQGWIRGSERWREGGGGGRRGG